MIRTKTTLVLAGLALLLNGGRPALADDYVVEYVATASRGIDMNDEGDVIGTSYLDIGCGSSCLPPEETVVWRNGERIVLPEVPDLEYLTVTGINSDGWICGLGYYQFVNTHAVVWIPDGETYTAIDLGTLPGRSGSAAAAIDDFGRVVGWSSNSSFPYNGAPFMWTLDGGIVDLSLQGFPVEEPRGMSPGGKVATHNYWYQLEDPSSVSALAPPPFGFSVQISKVAINDAGDQARLLGQTSGQRLIYAFRYHSEGTWQQLTFTGSGSLSTNSVGGINDAKDVTFTLLLHGQIAYGPDGVAQPLAPLVSAAYGGGSVAVAGELNAKGEIMAEMVIGQTGQRLVRLAPAEPCVSNCIRIASIDMRGKGPSRCDQGQAAAKSRVSVTDEAGNPLSGVTVTAHYMDDYWLDETIVGVTNARGQVSFTHRGPPCVGGIAILVTDATDLGTRTLDRTTGVLADYVLPLPNIGPWDGFSDNRTLLEGVSDKALPIGFALSQNYPNPFNPATTINYQLPVDAFVTLTVTDVLGRTVAVPVSRHEAAGYKSVRFDGSNLTSGIYFYRLQALSTDGRPLDLSSGQAGEFVETRKLMFMK